MQLDLCKANNFLPEARSAIQAALDKLPAAASVATGSEALSQGIQNQKLGIKLANQLKVHKDAIAADNAKLPRLSIWRPSS